VQLLLLYCSWRIKNVADGDDDVCFTGTLDNPCIPDYLVEKREQSGSVHFPLSGTSYPNNASCRWRIIAPNGKVHLYANNFV